MLRDFIDREIVYSIDCTVCGDRKDHVYEGTKTAAARSFKVAGWIETDANIVCPSCVKKGHFEP
jgi:rubredoxin